MSEKALQIVEERREAKGKGEKERYTQQNFRVSENKKVLFNDQCKETEESNGSGKTRVLFTKI